MRHRDNDEAHKAHPEEPAQMSGSQLEQEQEDSSQARLRMKVGPPEASWIHAKWLALAAQALRE